MQTCRKQYTRTLLDLQPTGGQALGEHAAHAQPCAGLEKFLVGIFLLTLKPSSFCTCCVMLKPEAPGGLVPPNTLAASCAGVSLTPHTSAT